MSKNLLIFSIGHGPGTEDLSPDSNPWYLKNYECYFERVQHLSLAGPERDIVYDGKSEFHFACSNRSLMDVLLSPIRLYRFVNKNKISHIVTYEQVWLWWTIILIRVFSKVNVYLLPITYPEQMYKITGKAISGKLPIWLERFFLKCSYKACYKVITSYNVGNYINWMMENRIIKKKIIIVNSVPETIVFPAFRKRLNEIEQCEAQTRKEPLRLNLIYVGRLHVEKMTDHLVKMMPLIKAKVPSALLTIIGEGPEKEALKEMAIKLNVSDVIKFANYIPNAELPDYLKSSDIFVSPSTGHSFREAAMCGLPIVAYNIDWIRDFLQHKETFYGVENIDYTDLADGIITMCKDIDLRNDIGVNIKKFALKYWSPDGVASSLESIFHLE